MRPRRVYVSQVFSANAINATLYDDLNFNFIRDIAPVASVLRVPQVLEVNPLVPAKKLFCNRSSRRADLVDRLVAVNLHGHTILARPLQPASAC